MGVWGNAFQPLYTSARSDQSGVMSGVEAACVAKREAKRRLYVGMLCGGRYLEVIPGNRRANDETLGDTAST